MRSKLYSSVLCLTVMGLFAGCEDNSHSTSFRGSGVVTTESRAVAGFSVISLESVGKVTVRQTGRESLTIRAEDNLLPLLQSRVVDGTLRLSTMYHANMQWNTPIEFAIEVKNLEGLEVSGPGSIDAKGIQGKQLSVSMSGQGDVTVAGKADLLDLYMSGVGKFHGERFQTEQATVRASGVGSAVVNVSDQLGATVSGTGSVQYIGSPRVRTSVSGFGHVKKYFGASAPEAVPSAPEPAEAAIEPPTTHAMNLGEDNLSLPMAAQDDAIPTAAAVSVAAPVAIRIFLVIIGGLLSSIGLLFVMWLFKSRRGQAAVLLVAGIMIGVVVLPVGVRLILGARYPTATKAPSAPRLWKKAAHQIAKVDARSERAREKAPSEADLSSNTALSAEAPAEAVEKDAEKPAPAPPAWLDSPPHIVGDAYQTTITVGPYTTRAECDEKLPQELEKALRDYVNASLGPEAADRVRLPADYLRTHLVKDQPWEEVRQFDFGPMTSLHVLLQFDQKVKDRILEEHRRAIVAGRLWIMEVWLTAGLSLLALVYGYLRADLASGGRHRGRLRLAAATAILGVVAAAIATIV